MFPSKYEKISIKNFVLWFVLWCRLCRGCENMILNTMKCNICVSFLHWRHRGTAHCMLQFSFLCREKNLKIVPKRKCVMTVFSYCPCCASRTLKNRNTKLFKPFHPHFSILTFFPIKYAELLLPPTFDRVRYEKKCEFDMILIFKLYISLLPPQSHNGKRYCRVEGHTMCLKGPEVHTRRRSFNI